jgi:hypothetical protein
MPQQHAIEETVMSRDLFEAWTGPGKRDGTIQLIEPRENAVHAVEGRTYLEWWYFDAILESGHVVVGFLQASELLSRKPGVELHVYLPSGEKLSEIRRYDVSDVRVSDQICDVHIGNNSATASYPPGGRPPVYRVHIVEGNLEAELSFTVEVPGWRPGLGKTVYGHKGYFAWIVPIPRARVEGTVRIGDTVIAARGIGYHDHNWGTADMRRILTHWYWGRIYAEDFTLIYAYVRTNRRFKNATSKPLMVAHEDRIIYSTGIWELREGPPVFNAVANREYPRHVTIESPGEFSLRLDVKEIIDAHDFLENLNPLLRWGINRTFGRPGYFRFKSDFDLTVFDKNETFHRMGQTLHEMVALK